MAATGKFRLSPSTVAKHFQHRCDRMFRWSAVAAADRGKRGIGWNVPTRVRWHSRPGVGLLMEEGDRFERGHVQRLIDAAGSAVLCCGFEGTKVRDLAFEKFAHHCRASGPPAWATQLVIALDDAAERRFLESYGLNPELVALTPAKPDLLEILPNGQGRKHVRIWDYKASQKARHAHFIQVAFYSLLLEHALEAYALDDILTVDTGYGVIRSREQEPTVFELEPYRAAIGDFLRVAAPRLFELPAADAHYHVQDGCMMCNYVEHCRAEANAGDDLSRIPYISSESKRLLKEHGIRTHRDLAASAGNTALLDEMRSAGHDLSINLDRYVASSLALEDGSPRALDGATLKMPRDEDVRVVITAEGDAVTATCFALGLKIYRGYDPETDRPIGDERVFVAETPDSEGRILLEFLRTLCALLLEVDSYNRSIDVDAIDDDPDVVDARSALQRTVEELEQIKASHPRLYRANPEHKPVLARREELRQLEKAQKQALKNVEKDARWKRGTLRKKLHFYVYDPLDLQVLTALVERHIFDVGEPELLGHIRMLVRLFPPDSILKDADTFRTVPGTVVIDVLRSLVALPAVYLYDLRTVSERFRPENRTGEESGKVFAPPYGFGWEFSNQIAFERIHDVWSGQNFESLHGGRTKVLTPPQIVDAIRSTVIDKLRATDSIVRCLKQRYGNQLLLRKEPFLLYDGFDPIEIETLEALRVFSLLETSLQELEIKHTHTMSVADRTSRLACISSMHYERDATDEECSGAMWFSFDPACRDAKFEPGEYGVAITPENDPAVLTGGVDGKLFEGSTQWWNKYKFRADIIDIDLESDPPRILVKPGDANFRENYDLSGSFVLDKYFSDLLTDRVLGTLDALQNQPEEARHVHQLIAGGSIAGWTPFVGAQAAAAVHEELTTRMRMVGDRPDTALNPGQWRAVNGVWSEPLTMIWGPPGTGKTHTVGHILLGYVLAAKLMKRQLRILVTAFTHHAIVNVLTKVAALAERYEVRESDIGIVKLGRRHEVDESLPVWVEQCTDEKKLTDMLGSDAPCLIVGSTVWSAYKATQHGPSPLCPWFDVVLVDEASQMLLSHALLALAVAKPTANIILAGDDQQLPPIIHGSYPEEHQHLLGSVFSFMRHRMDKGGDVRERMLFQLERNFRMNEPLTAYPRAVCYGGRFESNSPESRIRLIEPSHGLADALWELLLDPERASILCWYDPPRSFTSRNAIEAELAAEFAIRMAERLIDGRTGGRYSPERFAANGLAVLSPHRAQNGLIRDELRARGFQSAERPMPLVDTVEKLQGQERDVIAVSYGVADEEYAEAEAAFLLSRNRFNVAATRARHKLLVLCASTVLDVVPTDHQTLLDATMLKEFRSYCSCGSAEVPWTSGEHGTVLLKIAWRGFGR